MVQATLTVYKEAIERFLPTPTKSHYVFNLRDFSRVVQGCLLIPSKRMGTESDKLTRLWVHEVYRVFYDRLINDEDRCTFFNVVRETVSAAFKSNIDKVLGHLSLAGILHELLIEAHPIARVTNRGSPDFSPFPPLHFLFHFHYTIGF